MRRCNEQKLILGIRVVCMAVSFQNAAANQLYKRRTSSAREKESVQREGAVAAPEIRRLCTVYILRVARKL